MEESIIKLGDKSVTVKEPVFRCLKIILKAYNRLSEEASDMDKMAAIDAMLAAVFNGKLKLKHLSPDELSDFLAAVPKICGVDGGDDKPAKPVPVGDHWGDIYAHLSACLGWTWDYIDNNMTMSRLEAYKKYWQKNPPTHQLVASYLGYEYQDKQAGSQFLAAIAAKVKGANNG